MIAEQINERHVLGWTPSTLYSLPLQNPNTAFVESLSGYLVRLAAAHGLSYYSLVHDVLDSCISESRWTSMLCGMGSQTAYVIERLESLTSVTEFKQGTLLCLKDLISPHRLTRSIRAWCPKCLQDWADNGQTIYEPLLWTLEEYQICIQHRIPLQTACPCCGLQNKSLTPIDYCPHCGRWQGVHTGDDEIPCVNSVEVEQCVVEFLEDRPLYESRLCPATIMGFVCLCAEIVSGGSLSELARQCGLYAQHLKKYCTGQRLPTIRQLITLHQQANIPLRYLYFTRSEDYILDGRYVVSKENEQFHPGTRFYRKTLEHGIVRDIAKLKDSSIGKHTMASLAANLNVPASWLSTQVHSNDIVRSVIDKPIKSPRAQKYVPTTEVERVTALNALQSALNNPEPPTIASISCSTGLNPLVLKVHFPEQCKALLQKRKEFVNETHSRWKQALINAIKESTPPSLSAISRRLNTSDTMLRLQHPELCTIIVQNYKDYHQRRSQKKKTHTVNWDELIETSLLAYPPQSVSAICKRYRTTPQTFQKRHSKAFYQLKEKFDSYREEQRAIRIQILEQVVYELLNAKGRWPLIGDVERQLKKKNIALNTRLRAHLKEMMLENISPTT